MPGDSSRRAAPPDMIYRLHDRPPPAAVAAFQHVLAVFVGIITPPLILTGALAMSLILPRSRRKET